MFEITLISKKVYLLSFGLSLFLSLAITKILITVLSRIKFLQKYSKEGSVNSSKMVLPFGGIAVILSFLITLWVFLYAGVVESSNIYLFQVISLGVTLMLFLGIYDDLVEGTLGIKITIQVAIALLLYYFGFHFENMGDWKILKFFLFFFVVIWIIGITNSANLIDGEDGLASGIFLLAFLTLFLFYLNRGAFEASLLSIVLAGSILGFLIFNFPPAKIILGDSGSLPIGLLASLISLLPLVQGFTDEIFLAIPIVVFMVPLVDTWLAFFRRIVNGKNPFSKDKNHIHHRMIRLGLSPTQCVSILLVIGLYFDVVSMLPIFYIHLSQNFLPYFFIFIIINVIVLLNILNDIEKKKKLKSIEIANNKH